MVIDDTKEKKNIAPCNSCNSFTKAIIKSLLYDKAYIRANYKLLTHLNFFATCGTGQSYIDVGVFCSERKDHHNHLSEKNFRKTFGDKTKLLV